MSNPQNTNNHPPAQTPILLGFGGNTVEYLTIAPKHNNITPAPNIEHQPDTLQHTTPQPPQSDKTCGVRYLGISDNINK
jgi:hypothetical protein